jgi:hypothetical protein
MFLEHPTADGSGAQLQQVKESVQDEEAVSSSSARYHSPTVAPVYPDLRAEIVREKIPTYEQEDWPCQEECTAFTSPEYFPPVFLPPENKGFE